MARNTIWTANDRQYLKDNYASMTNVQMAKVLNRTVTAVMAQGNKFGLRKEAAVDGLTDKEREINHIVALQDEHEIHGKILDALKQCKIPDWLKTLVELGERKYKIVNVTRIKAFN